MSERTSISPEDILRTLLKHQHTEITAAIARSMDLFYARAASHPDISAILNRLSAEQFERLKAEQRAQSLLLLQPDTTGELRERAQAMGRVYAMAGIRTEWLISSMALYSDDLLGQLTPFLKHEDALRSLILQRLAEDLAGQLQGMESAALEERQVMERIDLLLLGDTPPDDLASLMLNKLLSIQGLDGAWIGRPDASGRLINDAVAGAGLADYLGSVEIRVDDSPLGQGPAGQAWRKGDTVIIDHWNTDTSTQPWQEGAPSHEWRASATIPIQVGGSAYAVLGLYSRIPGFFSYSSRQMLIRHLAVMLGVALSHRRQQKHMDRLNSLYRAFLAEGDILIRARSETEMLRKTCQRLAEGALFGTAYVVRPDTDGWFRPLAAAGVGSGILGSMHVNAHSGHPPSLIADTWQSGRLQYRNDYLSDPRLNAHHEILKRNNWASIAVVPVHRDGQIWAAMVVTSPDKGIFDREILSAIARVAKLLGHGLDELDLKDRIDKERTVQSWMARHDPLTGLPNRVALLDRIPEAMQRAQREEKLLGICMLDLDDFKPVNDRYGHAAGDALLQSIAHRLQTALRQTDFVARIGGDEFALVLENVSRMEDIENVMERVYRALDTPFLLPGGIEVQVGGSLGLTLHPFDDGDPEQLLRHADQALYAAKAEKGRRARFWCAFQGDDEASTMQRRPYIELLHQGALVAYYQPILHLASGQIIGVEALARLRQGNEILPPAVFLDHLDHAAGQLLAEQMMRQAMLAAQYWETAGFPLEVAINVPPEVLLSDTFLERIEVTIAESALPAERLTLEILESGEFLSLNLAKNRIAQIRAMGVRIALDDVGSAYASLLRLKEIAVDEVKLDQSFIQEIPQNPADLVFVMSVGALAQSIGARYVVEGAETAETINALAVLGVGCVQGYAIARPMPEEALLEWLRAWNGIAQDTQPRTLLGAYASHLQFDGIYRLAPRLLGQLQHLEDVCQCRLGEYLDHHGLEQSALGKAHQAYHYCVGTAHSATELDACRQHVASAMAATQQQIAEHGHPPHGTN